jgi:hypothetical protein
MVGSRSAEAANWKLKIDDWKLENKWLTVAPYSVIPEYL